MSTTVETSSVFLNDTSAQTTPFSAIKSYMCGKQLKQTNEDKTYSETDIAKL